MRTQKHAAVVAVLLGGVFWVSLGAQAHAQNMPQTLTLQETIASAVASNPASSAADQQFAQAQARLGQAQAQRRFSLGFTSAVSGSNASVLQPPPDHETFGTLQNTLTLPIPVGRRSAFAFRQAEEQLLAAQAALQSERLMLAGQAAGAYYDVLRKQALQTIAQETLAQAQRELSDAQKRNRAGDVAQLDVLQAEVPAAAAEANLSKAENDVAIAQETLNDLIGRPLDTPVSIADITELPPTLPYSLEQVRTLVLERSADVFAAEATVRADEAAVEAARLYREPSFSLQAIDVRSNDQTSFSREDTLQAAVTVPISDGGLGREQVREAEAVLKQAYAQSELTRKTALLSISAAFLAARSARAQRTATLAAQEIAQITYDKTVLGYRNGLFPLINVLNAQTALSQAQIASVQALYDAASAQTALEAALSGGTP